jgi:uncharacterized protein (TIGR03790 family)
MKRLLCALFLLSLGANNARADSDSDLASATIVVYNRQAPDSVALAYFYAKARRISFDHLVGLECSNEEEISRQEYDQTIAGPLRKTFQERNWWVVPKDDPQAAVRENKIHFVALIRGLPLKIRATTPAPGEHPDNNQITSDNKASVDSELSVLGLPSTALGGPANNPYFQSFKSIGEIGGLPLLLVCRLDGPTPEIVRRMITDAVETEKSGLWGRAYVDSANQTAPGLGAGDLWLKNTVRDLRRVGIPVVYDTESALFPEGFPMNDCVLYYGWYAGGVTGPFADPNFAFARGAIAVHIHSFSASTLRSAGANWVAPLLSRGAAASLGNVYEPYLQLTTQIDLFNDRLIHGFTFAESAYMATRVLSWMNIAVGDPLYRPYANWLQLEPTREKKSDWRMYHEFALKNSTLKPAEYLTRARAAASRAANGPMIEDLGLIEKESGDYGSAINYLQQARSLYSSADDILRTILEQVDSLTKSGNKKAALALVRTTIRLVPDAPTTGLLRKIEAQLTPPSQTPRREP